MMKMIRPLVVAICPRGGCWSGGSGRDGVLGNRPDINVHRHSIAMRTCRMHNALRPSIGAAVKLFLCDKRGGNGGRRIVGD